MLRSKREGEAAHLEVCFVLVCFCSPAHISIPYPSNSQQDSSELIHTATYAS